MAFSEWLHFFGGAFFQVLDYSRWHATAQHLETGLMEWGKPSAPQDPGMADGLPANFNGM